MLNRGFLHVETATFLLKSHDVDHVINANYPWLRQRSRCFVGWLLRWNTRKSVDYITISGLWLSVEESCLLLFRSTYSMRSLHVTWMNLAANHGLVCCFIVRIRSCKCWENVKRKVNINNVSLRRQALNQRDIVISRASELERKFVNPARVLGTLAGEDGKGSSPTSIQLRKTSGNTVYPNKP